MEKEQAETCPIVSIIMPAHNAGPYIAQAVRSVLEQTWTAWELIIVDDASTDDTAEVVARFLADARIRYLPSARIGHPAGVRNRGLREATGEFIAFLDADDVYLRNALELLITPLLENKRLNAAFGFPQHMNAAGQGIPQNVTLIPKISGGYLLPSNYRHEWEQIVMGRVCCLLAGLMMRRSFQRRVGLFNEALCGPEDFEFYLRMFLEDFHGVECLPAYIYRYRIHAESLTKAPEHYERILNSNLQIMEWLFTHPDLPSRLYALKPVAYVEIYRYLARERLLNNQPALARKIALEGLSESELSLWQWMRHCMPILLRSFLPTGVNDRLVAVRRRVREAWDYRRLLLKQA